MELRSKTSLNEDLGLSPPTEQTTIRSSKPVSEHRRHPRFPLTTLVEALEPDSNTQISGRSSDVSLSGCYVDTLSPFPTGTIIRIRLTRENVSFEANAKVVNSQIGMGMGISFTSAEKDQFRIYQKWINQISGISSPEPDELEKVAQTGSANDLRQERYSVLNDLLIALIRKGVLAEAEGNAMLKKLHK